MVELDVYELIIEWMATIDEDNKTPIGEIKRSKVRELADRIERYTKTCPCKLMGDKK